MNKEKTMSWISERICQLQNVFAVMRPTTPIEEEVAVSLETMKVTELKDLAKERGFKGYTSFRKAKLIEMLQQN